MLMMHIFFSEHQRNIFLWFFIFFFGVLLQLSLIHGQINDLDHRSRHWDSLLLPCEGGPPSFLDDRFSRPRAADNPPPPAEDAETNLLIACRNGLEQKMIYNGRYQSSTDFFMITF